MSAIGQWQSRGYDDKDGAFLPGVDSQLNDSFSNAVARSGQTENHPFTVVSSMKSKTTAISKPFGTLNVQNYARSRPAVSDLIPAARGVFVGNRNPPFIRETRTAELGP